MQRALNQETARISARPKRSRSGFGRSSRNDLATGERRYPQIEDFNTRLGIEST
jgi:hypothetical protein